MSEDECADLVESRQMKNCKVILERLDEASLQKCLQKYDLKLASQNDLKKPPIHGQCPSEIDTRETKIKRKKRKKSFLPRRKKHKRKHVKPLRYTDNENSSDDENLRVHGKVTADDRVSSKDDDSSLHKSDLPISIKTESEVVICHGSNPVHGNRAEREMLESKIREEKESILKQYLQNSFRTIRNNTRVSCDNDCEVEIIQVLTKPTGKTNYDGRKSEELPPKGWLTVNSECVLDSISNQERGDDEYDPREDSEDDKNTVIFDDEFQKDTDLEEFCEIEEKEVVSKKFNNREITNRKRQRLVKFKKKSLAGRTFAKFIRSKTKITEGASNEQEAGEKSIECVSEECLREVCTLVERLHDLYRVILHLKKQIPKNAEPALHFTRVINAQQENFQKEIRKSQKTIIRCYEKMLLFYSNTSQVARVISKRTSLRVEDIVNVISRCILIEGQCEADETAVGHQEKAIDSVHRKNCENFARSAQGKTTPSECLPRQQTINSSSSYYYPKLVHRPSGELHWACPARETNPASTDYQNVPKDWLQYVNGHQVTRRCKSPARVQQNPPPNHYFKEQFFQSGLNQMGPRTLGIERHLPPKSIDYHMANRYGVDIPVQSVASRHGFNYTTSVFQQRHPHAEDISKVVSPVSVVLPPVQSNTNYHPLNQVLQNGPNSLFKVTGSSQSSGCAKNPNGPVVSSHNQRIPPSEAQGCPLNTILTDSVRLSGHRGLFVKTVELSERNDNSTAENSEDVTQVLDPTIPQKLTMRNCRLQAGPVLDLEGEGAKKLNSPQSLTGQKTCTRSRNLDPGDSKSRVYVCAQNDCKNPGVRICRGCQSVIYCSETCQLKHWTLKHKSECYQLKELRG